GKGGLRGAVAAKAASGQHVGVDGIAVGLLIRTAIGREWAGQRRCQRFTAVAAISACVGDDPDLDRSERAVTSCAEPHLGGHLMARCGANELLLAGKFPLHRPPGLQRGEYAEIFGQHLLLAAKPTADPLGEHMHVSRAQTEYVAELLLRYERRLR